MEFNIEQLQDNRSYRRSALAPAHEHGADQHVAEGGASGTADIGDYAAEFNIEQLQDNRSYRRSALAPAHEHRADQHVAEGGASGTADIGDSAEFNIEQLQDSRSYRRSAPAGPAEHRITNRQHVEDNSETDTLWRGDSWRKSSRNASQQGGDHGKWSTPEQWQDSDRSKWQEASTTWDQAGADKQGASHWQDGGSKSSSWEWESDGRDRTRHGRDHETGRTAQQQELWLKSDKVEPSEESLVAQWKQMAIWMSDEKQAAEWQVAQERQRADALEARLRATELQMQALQQVAEMSASSASASAQQSSYWRGRDLQASRSPGKGSKGGSQGSVPLGSMLFAGSLISLPEEGDNMAIAECQEALAVFGQSSIQIPADTLPDNAGIGAVLFFKLAKLDQSSPLVVAGSIIVAAQVSAERERFVGTMKAFSMRKDDRVGFINCLAAYQLYSCDIYVHGSMIEGFGHGDTVCFGIHVNSQGKPQASNGTVVRLVQAATSDMQLPSDGALDITVKAPGRVLPLEAADG